MLENLKNILRSDALDPSIDLFPPIDTKSLEIDLSPQKLGRERGTRNQPSCDATDLDSTEREIVHAVDVLRTKGLKLYREHASVYTDRLQCASEASNEIKIVAGTATGNFRSECQVSESAIQEEVTRLHDAAVWRLEFRKRHGLMRPGIRLDSRGVRWLAISGALVVIEAVLNSYLFAQKNELGLLGGISVAILISLANVGVASCCGYYSRYIWHLNFLVKLYGLAIVLAWVAMVAAFNVGVAHFRDILVSQDVIDWNIAARGAVDKMIATPLAVESVESWLLILIGALISFGAFLKAFYADDPYPLYGTVERTLRDGRREYMHAHDETRNLLQSNRDEATVLLQEAIDAVETTLSEALDAQEGHSSLDVQLHGFIARCDFAVQSLLQKYREANCEARSEKPPAHFAVTFRFPEFEPTKLSENQRNRAESARKEVGEIIGKAIDEINDEYDRAVGNFRTAKQIEESAAEVRN